MISSLDLTGPVTRQAVERTCERLVEEEAIVPDVAAGIDVVLGVAIAWLVLRTNLPGRRWLDWGASAALAIPGIVLAIGYLRNQRLVDSIEDIVAVQVDWETDSVAITTHRSAEDLDARMEKRTVTTGCGQGTMFGDLMAEIDKVSLPAQARFDEDTLYGLLDAVRHDRSTVAAAAAVADTLGGRSHPTRAQAS